LGRRKFTINTKMQRVKGVQIDEVVTEHPDELDPSLKLEYYGEIGRS